MAFIQDSKVYMGFRAHPSKIDLAFKLFEAGESVRRAARQVKVSPSTIQRWNERFYSDSLLQR